MQHDHVLKVGCWPLFHVRIQRGAGGPDPPKDHKNIRFLSNTGLDPLKITKLPSQHSMLDHHQHTSETPFKWRFAGGLMMARLYWYLDPPSPHQQKKINVTVEPPLAKLSGDRTQTFDLKSRLICYIFVPLSALEISVKKILTTD